MLSVLAPVLPMLGHVPQLFLIICVCDSNTYTYLHIITAGVVFVFSMLYMMPVLAMLARAVLADLCRVGVIFFETCVLQIDEMKTLDILVFLFVDIFNFASTKL